MASTPTSSCRCSAKGLDWAAVVPAQRLRRGRPDARWIAFGSGERASLSRHADVVGHHAAHDLVGADRRQAGHARRICARARLRRAGDPASARRNIGACGPRSAPTSCSTPRAAARIDHPGYGRCDAFYRRPAGERGADLQQLGRRMAAARRREDQPLAAVRPGAGLALSQEA